VRPTCSAEQQLKIIQNFAKKQNFQFFKQMAIETTQMADKILPFVGQPRVLLAPCASMAVTGTGGNLRHGDSV